MLERIGLCPQVTLGVLCLLVSALVTTSCGSSSPSPPAPVPVPETTADSQVSPESPQPDLDPPARPRTRPKKEPVRPQRVVEIESENSEAKEAKSLVEASNAELQRKRHSSKELVAVIDNDNLAEFAKKGDLTYAEGNEIVLRQEEEDESSVGQEDYWRDQALELRLSWSATVEERQNLEDQAALLRRRFYAEDDPFVRDGKIKPDWDRALDRITAAKQEEEEYRRELEDLYDQASIAGADISWLEEGRELEPQDSEEANSATESLPSHEVKDPPVGNENFK